MPVFTANVPGVLKVGDWIEIGGKIKDNARNISVNLCAQEGEEPRDVVLHFDVRFRRDNIVSLSRKNGVWIGSGNYDTNYNMFVPGTIFRIVLEIKDTDVITIYCQGKFHSNFLPKIPLAMAKYIVAWADIERITHCYFHLGTKAGLAEYEGATVVAFAPKIPHPTSPLELRDLRRCPKNKRKMSTAPPHLYSSDESFDEDGENIKSSTEDRKNWYFYDTVASQPQDIRKFRQPRIQERNRYKNVRPEYSKKYRDVPCAEKNDIESYSYETPSKSMNSSVIDSDEMLRTEKKRSRRGKQSSFAQLINFMGKPKRRN